MDQVSNQSAGSTKQTCNSAADSLRQIISPRLAKLLTSGRFMAF